MSAFLCDADTFDYLGTAAMLYATGPIDAPAMAARWYAQNVRSVEARYPGDAGTADPYTFRPVTETLDPVWVLKSIQCAAYQSCETDDYQTTRAALDLDALRAAVLAALGHGPDYKFRTLPGYDDAPWGWTRRNGIPAPPPAPPSAEERNARTLDARELATAIRGALRREFPRVKFGVTIARYAGGSSVYVKWTDGPTGPMVDRAIAIFDRQGFDGMTDSETNAGPFQLPGTGEWVRAYSYVSTERRLTPAAEAAIDAHNAQKYGAEASAAHKRAGEYWHGRAYQLAAFDPSGALLGFFDVKRS